ncbi:MAG: PP2C family protein-serine/threonine phosphatase [Acidimicrobiales bacterium]
MAVEDRLRALELVTDIELGRLDVDDLLAELLERIAHLMGADTVAVLLLDKATQLLIARSAWGIEEEVRQGVRLPVGHGFAGRIAATRQPIALDRVDPNTVANPLLWEKGIQAMLGVPLLSGNELLGVLHVGSLSRRHFTEADTDLLAHVARRAAAAIQVRELELERAAARVLQRSLLPSRLPDLAGFEFAARYVPAEVGGVGGDWYDAFVLPDGRLWVMVGDVVGHGMQAAVVMGRLRAALRSYALDGHPPEEVLARADRKLQFFEPEQTATVLCAALDPPYDNLRLSLAGHPPPVIASHRSPTALVDVRPGLPLGVDPKLPRPSATVPLPAGTALVAYTDGLIERRGQSLDHAFPHLCHAIQPLPAEQICIKTMDRLVGNIAPQDDIALFALRRLP